MLEQFNQIIDLLKSNIYVLAIFYVLLSFIAAFIVDRVIIAIIKKAVKRLDNCAIFNKRGNVSITNTLKHRINFNRVLAEKFF